MWPGRLGQYGNGQRGGVTNALRLHLVEADMGAWKQCADFERKPCMPWHLRVKHCP